MYESQISFTLDTICPWTYLAKKRLDKALGQVSQQAPGDSPSKVRFTVRYLPFQLYPEMPAAGRDKYAWYRDEKYAGSEERMAAYALAMGSLGDGAGVAFRFGGDIANTLDAHRVVQHFQAREGPDTANRLVSALYRMYFEEERHPSSPETLVAACVEAGIDEGEARRVVEDEPEEGLVEARMAIREQKGNGVDSVPYVMIEGRRRDITLIGAKEVEEYAKALQTIIKESG